MDDSHVRIVVRAALEDLQARARPGARTRPATASSGSARWASCARACSGGAGSSRPCSTPPNHSNRLIVCNAAASSASMARSPAL